MSYLPAYKFPMVTYHTSKSIRHGLRSHMNHHVVPHPYLLSRVGPHHDTPSSGLITFLTPGLVCARVGVGVYGAYGGDGVG
jgi:hypothetical protein